MRDEIILALAKQLAITKAQVENTLDMLSQGNTVPFIARYRKEQTNGLDEEQILVIQKQYDYQIKLQERKEAVLKSIEQQGKLTAEILAAVNSCTKLSQVEDVYRPYVQKKKTRAAIAIKNGLQPLADWMLTLPLSGSLQLEAEKYVNEETVKTVNEAIQGAKDIIAEQVSDNAQLRWDFKDTILTSGALKTVKKKDAEDEKHIYEMYYDRTERLAALVSHRVMAIDRAEKEKVLTVSLSFDEEALMEKACSTVLKGQKTVCQNELISAIEDGCTRLLFPSIEREIRSELSEKAHTSSIEVFSLNLEKLLLQAPLKGRRVLGFDPGYYNGCKLAVIDETGKVLGVDKIYPFRKKEDVISLNHSKAKLLDMYKKHHYEIVAIGNGTASRESEKLVAEFIKENNLSVSYAIISEAGASVWSAQEAAREEFPDMAIEERSAVSIARRLLDPLAELIKIDPKSIGVGQYQHDLPQKELTNRLDEATMKCVNRTGADLNTASVELLTHISGLNSGIAKEIINYRNENGKFTNRNQLLKVKKLGPKAFQQCAGFLRISDGDEPLDKTSIHPESYNIAKQIMQLCDIKELGQADINFDKAKLSTIEIDKFTLNDIEEAIKQPLRDYRDQFDGALLKSNILELADLHPGDQLSGTVRNVVDFGAFVDIGLHDDGLVHTSRLAMHKVNHPSDIVSVGDIVTVYVIEIDEARGRVQLSLLSPSQLAQRNNQQKGNKMKDKKHINKKKIEEQKINDAMQKLLAQYGSKH